MFDKEQFGKKIKYFRQRQGLTQEQLSEMANISFSYLTYIESGRNKPTVDVIINLLNALNINYSELTDDSSYNNELTISLLEKYNNLDEKGKNLMLVILTKLLTF